MDMMRLIMMVIVIQALWSTSITLYTHSLPGDVLVGSAFELGADVGGLADDIQGNLERQTNIPVLDMGALVFYSGNILLDILVNFISAIPQMITMLISGIMFLFSIPEFVQDGIQVFATVVLTAMYLLSMMSMIMSFRSGRGLVS